MSQTTVRAKQSFAHGAINVNRGDMTEMDTVLADELDRAGLVDKIVEKLAKGEKKHAAEAGAPKDDAAANPVAPEKAEGAKAIASFPNKAAKPLINKDK